MLSITPTASEAIDGILDSPNVPEGAGVRIATEAAGQEGEAAFQLSVVPEPSEGDEVIADGNVFIEPETSRILDESELDAAVEGGEVRFILQRQAA
jgi:iron-sulfur cluster assembly protein